MDNAQNSSEIRQDAPSAEAAGRIKQSSVTVVFLLTFFTGGIYLPIWFLTRLAQFNGLQSEEKLGKGELVGSLVALVAAVLLGLFAGLAAFFNPAILAEGGSLATYADLIANIVTLLAIIALVQQTFRAKRILLDHYRGYLQQDVAFSPLLTLLFLNIYLQYKINRLSSWQPVGR